MLCRHFFAFLLGFVLYIAVLEHGFLISMKGPENGGLLKPNLPLKPSFQKLISREILALALRLSFLIICGLNRTKVLFIFVFLKRMLKECRSSY